MTELSIGELDSLVLKAYRGAGFSWGLSQEAGRAAAWMAMRGLPAANCFAELLQKTDGLGHSALTPEAPDGNWSNCNGLDSSTACCPVIVGTMLSDFGWTVGGELTLCPVYSPLILIPFVSLCAKASGTALCINIDDAVINLMADGRLASGVGDGGCSKTAVVISEWRSASTEVESSAPLARRAAISDAALAQLEALAHRTYVPASDQSRSGAGAGLTDND